MSETMTQTLSELAVQLRTSWPDIPDLAQAVRDVLWCGSAIAQVNERKRRLRVELERCIDRGPSVVEGRQVYRTKAVPRSTKMWYTANDVKRADRAKWEACRRLERRVAVGAMPATVESLVPDLSLPSVPAMSGLATYISRWEAVTAFDVRPWKSGLEDAKARIEAVASMWGWDGQEFVTADGYRVQTARLAWSRAVFEQTYPEAVPGLMRQTVVKGNPGSIRVRNLHDDSEYAVE